MIAISPNGHEKESAVPEAPLLATVSASRLNCFHGCRLKFYFQFVLQLKKPATAALHVGKSVHAALQAWNLARWRGHPLPAFREVLETAWNRELVDNPVQWEDDEPAHKQTAWSLVELYLAQTPIPADEKPLGVEVRVEADLEAKGLPRLVGVMDLIRSTKDGGVIVDFKTSATTPNADRVAHLNEIQLSCYAALYRSATGERESGFELHHLVKTKSPKLVVTPLPPMTSAQETRLYRAVESYVAGVESKDYVPSPSIGCLSCQYFGECRKWKG